MSKTATIKNDRITATISSKGAEFTSIIFDGKEQLWERDAQIWDGQAPILFPICGGLKDGKFIYEGKEYFLEKHGFVRGAEFEIESADETKAVFLYKSNEETIKKYPFEFEFRVIFCLDGTDIKIDYSVKNMGANTMYYSVGAHEAYACPEGVETYSVIFEKTETLKSALLDGTILGHNFKMVGENIKELPLKKDYFLTDALIFTEIESRKVSLKNVTTGSKIDIDFKDFDNLLIWQKPGAKYICIEPWAGLPDYSDTDCKIETKAGINPLEAGKESVHTHIISF